MQNSSWYIHSLILILLYVAHVSSLSLTPYIEPEALDALRSSNKMDEFIKHLGLPDTSLCHPDKDDTSPPMFNEDLPFGDLIMGKETSENGGKDENEGEEDNAGNIEHDFTSNAISEDKGTDSGERKPKWEDGVIPYYISNDYTPEQRLTIEKAIELMNSELSRVQFRPFNSLTDKNYVMIYSGKGCYAKLGMAGGQQPVSLQADKCLKTGIVQHELMHAVGFSHEQNRPDRDYYIQLLYENIPEKWRKEYERNNPSDAAYVGDYDYLSVMHYPPQAPKSDGKRLAFILLDDTVDESDVGNREALSDLDIQKIDQYYTDDDDQSDTDV